MATVTVGVPVYNGAHHLERCLECLRTQTFKDIEVLIYDNASTDETPTIAARFAKADPRFKYYRQSENRGVAANFIDVMEAAKSDYFLWRADDDFSEPNFIEELYRLFQENPHTRLAAAPIWNIAEDNSVPPRFFPLPERGGKDRLTRIRKTIFGLHVSWFYGLWHTDTLRREFHGAWNAYPHAWAADHLTLFPLILDEAISTTDKTSFTQMTRYRPVRTRPAVRDMIELRRSYLRRCRASCRRAQLDGPGARRLYFLIRRHVSDRC